MQIYVFLIIMQKLCKYYAKNKSNLLKIKNIVINVGTVKY
jgi:hypothetical protein